MREKRKTVSLTSHPRPFFIFAIHPSSPRVSYPLLSAHPLKIRWQRGFGESDREVPVLWGRSGGAASGLDHIKKPGDEKSPSFH
jgi:hypothetical protein